MNSGVSKAGRIAPASRLAPAGFTLLEVMIVVAILGILMLAANLFFRGAMPQNRVRDAADRLQAQLRAARLHAISTARTVQVTISSGTRQLVTGIDLNANGSIESNETAALSLTSAPQVTVTTAASNGLFRPSGDFVSSNGYWRVTIGHPGTSNLLVYVFAAGHIQVSELPLD